eukprot:3514119-Prymnesium_polylepis.1
MNSQKSPGWIGSVERSRPRPMLSAHLSSGSALVGDCRTTVRSPATVTFWPRKAARAAEPRSGNIASLAR